MEREVNVLIDPNELANDPAFQDPAFAFNQPPEADQSPDQPPEPPDPDQLPEEMVGELPASLVESILGRWGHSDSEPSAGDPPPPPLEETGVAGGEVPEPPSPPGGPLFTDPSVPPAPTVKLSDGTEIPLSQVEAILKAQSPPFTPPPPAPPYAPPPPPIAPLAASLPPFTEEDLENPAIRAVIMVAAKQQEALEAQGRQLETLAASQRQVQVQEHRQIVVSAVTAFKDQYQLPDELMRTISDRAGSLVEQNLIATARHDQVTGTIIPNPFEAVTKSLADAYWLTPQARQYEFERQANARNAALARQRKLNGVGGASGSAPQQASSYDLSTKEGRRQAAVAEAAAAMGLSEGSY